MEAIGGFIIFASFAAFILGVVNVIRPQAWMKVRKRLVGLFIILGSMGGCVAGASMVPPAPASTQAAVEGETGKAAAPAAVQPAQQAGMTQVEFEGLWSGVKNRMERCDMPTRRAGAALGTGDVYAAYGPTKQAAEACKDVWLTLDEVPLPRSAKGDVRKALEKGVDDCETAMFLKTQALEALLKVLDGDARPSAMEAVKTGMQRGQAGSTVCILSFMGAADKAGLVLPELEDAMAAAKAGG
ncbi:hypothetical protein HNP32_001292 [Brevundimonas bullata]|uniref:Uncharacterized protein n=1 Tax=Brevundimonas bullata TaxID=13160 RepID=A0A7W7N2Q0_9CAUL|nr:hypothetical protein [Brevundimonas bullata]MBB4797568.1 hypothetical protein [Brevundimonas bullata]MBB6382528.1 hypothetical protein [Brevundimonas bullata]